MYFGWESVKNCRIGIDTRRVLFDLLCSSSRGISCSTTACKNMINFLSELSFSKVEQAFTRVACPHWITLQSQLMTGREGLVRSATSVSDRMARLNGWSCICLSKFICFSGTSFRRRKSAKLQRLHSHSSNTGLAWSYWLRFITVIYTAKNVRCQMWFPYENEITFTLSI